MTDVRLEGQEFYLSSLCCHPQSRSLVKTPGPDKWAATVVSRVGRVITSFALADTPESAIAAAIERYWVEKEFWQRRYSNTPAPRTRLTLDDLGL
jgi:hypothetical protein